MCNCFKWNPVVCHCLCLHHFQQQILYCQMCLSNHLYQNWWICVYITCIKVWNIYFVPTLTRLPKLYVSVASGIISLAISPLNVIVSVSASPNIISPSALMLPVECFLLRLSLGFTLTVPVPFGKILN